LNSNELGNRIHIKGGFCFHPSVNLILMLLMLASNQRAAEKWCLLAQSGTGEAKCGNGPGLKAAPCSMVAAGRR
jgi:hypothetical protein